MATRFRDDSTVASSQHNADDWEEWEDDDVITLIDINEPLPAHRAKISDKETNFLHVNSSNASTDSFHHSLTQTNNSPTASFWEPSPVDPKPQQNLTVPSFAPGRAGNRNTRHQSSRASRNHMSRIIRHRSRKGKKTVMSRLRVITDMSKLHRPNQPPNQIRSPETRRPKFVDLAALAALEGEPTAESVGNWNWLSKSRLRSPEVLSPPQNPRSPDQQLSPEDRPIVIGISLPSDEVASHSVSPQTATVETYSPVGQQSTRLVPPGPSTARSNPFSDANQPKSVWSPDTPDTASSFSSIRRTSSVYSQATMVGNGLGMTNTDVPPVPALPANYKKTQHQKFISLHVGRSGEDEDDTGTPCTLFEEDGTPTVVKSSKGKLSAITPDSANSQNDGWWDHHVVTPFLDRTMSFASRTQRGSHP
ncbi:hypothetical protein PT974_08570 [Cladobotryum mycophilum]|uniref:Uncharacterized protein n=1 Tax=Cladobotryum mycophilum TaxID=491253 RepID=A0ABR0SDR2_9HYPO